MAICGKLSAVMANYHQRLHTVRAAGGIAELDVCNGDKVVPEGWLYDYYTCYWHPPTLMLPSLLTQPTRQ